MNKRFFLTILCAALTCLTTHSKETKSTKSNFVTPEWVTKLKGIEKLRFHQSDEIKKLMSVTIDPSEYEGEGTVVWEHGESLYSCVNGMGEKGGGSPVGRPTRSNAEIEEIKDALNRLPISVLHPPTKQRILLIHRFDGEKMTAFGYDLGNLPQEVLDLLRLAKTEFAAWTPSIPSDGSWQANGKANGTLVVMHTTDKLLTCAQGEPLRVWDAKTHELMHEARGCPPATKMACNQDETLLAVMLSGRCSVLNERSREVIHVIQEIPTEQGSAAFNGAKWLPGLLWLKCGALISGFYNAKTWEPVLAPSGFPEFTRDFVSLGGNNCLALSQEGKLSMISAGESVFEFSETGVTSFTAAAAPASDLTAVAFQYGPARGPFHESIQIIETATGKLTRELLPFEVAARYDYLPKTILWSKDGAYIFGDLANGQIAIWNAKNGRHRATLGERRGSEVNNTLISPDQSTLYQYLESGQIHYWNLEATLSKVRAFEAELALTRGK